MKISYKFATETIDIEVEDSWGTVILDFDRLEYNNNQKEKRRHCSLNAYDKDDNNIESDANVENLVLSKFDNERLYAAISKLKPNHQDLIREAFFMGKTYTQIAKERGVTEGAIRHSIERAKNNLKQYELRSPVT